MSDEPAHRDMVEAAREMMRTVIAGLGPAEVESRRPENRLPPGLVPRLVSRTAAAAYMAISPNHFDEHVAPLVPPLRFGRRSVWDLTALDRWLDQKSGLVQAQDTRPIGERLNGRNQTTRR